MLNVYGANFVSGAVVNWNGSPRSTTFMSGHELQAQILAADVAQNTAGLISVTNPAPGGGKSSAYAQVEVHAPTATIVASNPASYNFGWYALLAADFNNDGNLDLLGPGPQGIDLRLGNGDGTFRFGSIAGRNYRSPLGIVYGDFNGDGNLDIAYVSGDSNNPGVGKQVVVMLGDGTGKFSLGSTLKSWLGFSKIAVGDFNRDGKLDLVVTQGLILGIYLGNGDGTFAHFKDYPIPGTGGGQDVELGDFNGDGKLDLLTLNQFRDTYVLLGRGDGTFQYPGIYVSSVGGCGGVVVTLVVSDFNGDGVPDLAQCSDTEVAVLMGNGNGTFQSPILYPAGASFEIATGDFTSNGKTDIVISRNDNNQFVWLPSNGDGTFQSELSITLPTSSNGELGLAAGDFSRNGLLGFGLVIPNGTAYIYTQQ